MQIIIKNIFFILVQKEIVNLGIFIGLSNTTVVFKKIDENERKYYCIPL